MGQLISFSIDLTKFKEQVECIQKGKNGRSYANITISVNDITDQFGNNVNAWISQSKEEREAKATRHFVGNGKVVFPKPEQAAESTSAPQATPSEEEDLPF